MKHVLRKSSGVNGLNAGKIDRLPRHLRCKPVAGVPRSLNRDPLGLHADALPFVGGDIWTLYELSAECARSAAGGRGPRRAGLRQRKLVESKSFKLYLNSFNQTKFNSWDEVQQTLERDLSACAQGNVTVSLYRLHELEGQPIAHFHGTCIDDQDIEVESYEFSSDYRKTRRAEKWSTRRWLAIC